MLFLRNTLMVCVTTLLLLAQSAQAAFTQVVSFGDSLSDVGNVFAATAGGTPPAPYFSGRFSDGPVWAETLATGLGLSAATASNLGGTNYAWGGARTNSIVGVPSTQAQVATYLTDVSGSADANALYTILTGGNDINDTDGSPASIAALQADAIEVANLAGSLIAAGAQNILVLNVPNLGLAPIADGNEAGATGLTSIFNGTLASALASLASPFVALVDTFTVSNDIAANPAAFGLTNVDDACFDTSVPSLCTNPEDYLFWDDLHPTAAGHDIIASAALSATASLPSAVPVPGAVWFMLSGLGSLVLVRRARS